MEHGASDIFKKEMEIVLKSEVEAAATSFDQIDIEISLNHLKKEPELVQYAEIEPVLLVKEEISMDNSQDGNVQQCVQAVSAPADACRTGVGDLLNVKEELKDMDIGPNVLQYMDIHYTINKNMSAVTEENAIVNNCNEVLPGSRTKMKNTDVKLRVNKPVTPKYCDQEMIKDEYDESHVKLQQHKNIQQHHLLQHYTNSSKGFKCGRKIFQPHLPRKFTRRTGEKPHRCNRCGIRFKLRSTLTVHMRFHIGEESYQCDTCHARFTRKGNLIRHMGIHTGDKPYPCDTCDAKFTRNSDLVRHIRIHSVEKPYQCSTCHARFTQSGHLTRHKRVHTGEKPYHCDTCYARFADSGTFTRHKRVHMGEKPYQCDTCDAKYAQSGQLTRHKRVHSGEKPSQGETCDVRSTSNGNLTKHKTVHLGEKPFECTHCSAKFSHKSSLYKHRRRRHPK